MHCEGKKGVKEDYSAPVFVFTNDQHPLLHPNNFFFYPYLLFQRRLKAFYISSSHSRYSARRHLHTLQVCRRRLSESPDFIFISCCEPSLHVVECVWFPANDKGAHLSPLVRFSFPSFTHARRCLRRHVIMISLSGRHTKENTAYYRSLVWCAE